VARLEVEVDQGDPTLLPALAFHQLNGRLDCERRIADPACARDEGHDDRPLKRRGGTGCDPAKDVEGFPRQPALGGPIGIAVLNESLVILRRDVVADDEEKDVRVAADQVDESSQLVLVRAQRQNDEGPARCVERGFADVVDGVDALKPRDRWLELPLDGLGGVRRASRGHDIDGHSTLSSAGAIRANSRATSINRALHSRS